jgi:hypothetical protein
MPQGIEVFREAPLAVVKAVAVPANKADPEEEDMPWLHTAARLAFERLPTQSQHIWMSLADAFSRPPKKSPGEYTPSHRHSASSHDTVPASSLTPQATFYAAMPSRIHLVPQLVRCRTLSQRVRGSTPAKGPN